MTTRIAFRLLSLSVALWLGSCGAFDSEERDTWRDQAEAACLSSGKVQLSSVISRADSIDGKGVCGIEKPLSVSALADGSVEVGDKSVVLSCPMTSALDTWVKDVVMPAAYRRYGVAVVSLTNMGTYNCRTRNNVPGARLSEHAFANAFDFSGVILANGYQVSVKSGWKGSATDQAFLREIAAGACGPFSTFLGPGSDGLHEDHFHIDLARHNAKGTYRYCRPRPAIPDDVPPTVMASGPLNDPPMSDSVPPDAQVWPRVLPQTLDGAHADDPPPPDDPAMAATVYAQPVAQPVQRQPITQPDYSQPQPVTPQPVYAQPAIPEAPLPPQPADCPPGFICTPINGAAPPPADLPTLGPAPLGWHVGAQPADITGSTTGYSDQ